MIHTWKKRKNLHWKILKRIMRMQFEEQIKQRQSEEQRHWKKNLHWKILKRIMRMQFEEQIKQRQSEEQRHWKRKWNYCQSDWMRQVRSRQIARSWIGHWKEEDPDWKQ